jgi:hypothetical protein
MGWTKGREAALLAFASEVAGGLLAVAVAAFDDESYVIWTES